MCFWLNLNLDPNQIASLLCQYIYFRMKKNQNLTGSIHIIVNFFKKKIGKTVCSVQSGKEKKTTHSSFRQKSKGLDKKSKP